MAFDINTNLDALVAIDNLGKSELSMTTCVQRLASGLRINSAKDDPAGLAIANSMAAQLSGFNQATVNINNGISYLQTADGGMSNITNLLQRMRALSVVAANGTNSTSDLVSLNSEMQQLKSEIQQIAVTTNFNGIQLLDGTVSQVQIQVGPGAGDVITVAMGQSMQLSELGSSGAGSTVTGTATVAALNAGDLTLNEVAVGASTAGGGIGQAASSATEISSAINAVTGTSGVSASAMTTLTAAAPANNATIQDFVVNDVLVSPQGAGMANLIAAINQAGIAGVSAATNKTGGWTLTSSTGENINIELSGTAANQTIAASDRAAFESATGLPDSAVGTEAVAAIPAVPGVPAQYNGQGQLIAPAIPGQPYQPPIAASYATTTGVVTLTSSNASGILIGGNAAASAGFTNGLANQAALSTTPGIVNVNVLTAGAAEQAITSADNAILAVDSARAQVGAYQNRLSYQASVVQTSIENMSASLSVVRDTNFALETTNLSVAKILQQVGTAMVAHANSTPGLVLNLLR